MKTPILSLLLLSPILPGAEEPNPIRLVSLDAKAVHAIAISRNHVTTVSFPEAISAIDGAFASTQSDQPGLFQLAHTPGSSFLSLRCLTNLQEVRPNLNVRWNNETYVLRLAQSPAPDFSVVFQRPPQSKKRTGSSSSLSPASLLGLLDKAKAYPFLNEHHPDSVADVLHVDHREDPPVSPGPDYGDEPAFETHIQEVFRFENHDTLVFHLSLRNPGKQERFYRADSFAVQAGDHIFPASLTDGTGVLPPESASTVYLAITGTSSGGENNLSPENDFTISVESAEPPSLLPPLTPTESSK
jgi:hypothetical protein